ncbi:MAG: AAA family ATPase, partial [Methyloceanibacter sp.]
MADKFYEKVGTAVRPHSVVPKSAPPEVICGKSTPETESPFKAVAMTGEKRWAANHDVFWGATQTYDTLPCGIYRCAVAQGIGSTLIKMETKTDHLIDLPDDASRATLAEFDRFWTRESEFRERGFLLKRGYLLWGPPGGGKTSMVNMLAKRIIEDRDGVVILIDEPGTAASCLHMLRNIERDRPLIALMEDLDALIERYGENQFLSLLDGEAQIDRLCCVATCFTPDVKFLTADLR